MRASRVHVGVRVKVIAGQYTGEFGTINAVMTKGPHKTIAVKIDGQVHARHYTANDLRLVHKLDNSR